MVDAFPVGSPISLPTHFSFPSRDALYRAAYTEVSVVRLLGVHELPAARQIQRMSSFHQWRTRTASPLNAHIRLFLLGQVVTFDAANAAFHPLAVEDLVRYGLLAETGGGVRATVQIVPFQNFHIAADWPQPTDAIAEPVMGVAASTRALAQMMISRPVESALDLGCGSGVLALLAARNANRVWAVDLNPRAVAMTRFNAALNGIDNLDVRVGDLFDPVYELAFDRIVCNPPFVIAPTAGRLHSQTGRPADDFCRSIVRAAAASAARRLLPNSRELGPSRRRRLAKTLKGMVRRPRLRRLGPACPHRGRRHLCRKSHRRNDRRPGTGPPALQ